MENGRQVAETANSVGLQLVIPWWGWFGVIGALIGIGVWIGIVQTNQKSFREFMTNVRSDIKEVRSDIKKLLIKVSERQTVKPGSPLQLTELGKQISEEIDAPSLARSIASEIERRIDGRDPYDIQTISFDYVEHQWTPNKHVDLSIKNAAFNHGIMKMQVLDVIAIELRDYLIKISGAQVVKRK